MEEITSSACLANSPQNYLVCITVHKAKSLAAFNSDTYVLVRCNQQTKRTVTYQNSEDPYFHDYFVFELFNDLQTLLRQIVNFTVMKKNDFYKRNENIGEVFIDLRTVWEFPYHAFYKKWISLESPSGGGQNEQTRGYLQLDIAIVAKDNHPMPIVTTTNDLDIIENNLLVPQAGGMNTRKIMYSVSIHYGEFLQKGDYSVHITFAGSTGKTKRIGFTTTTPEWNQKIVFRWYYPSLCQTFLIELMLNEFMVCRPLYETEIFFEDITHPYTKDSHSLSFLPALGPTFVHLYRNKRQKTNYIGRVMLTIHSDNLDGATNRIPTVSQIPRLFTNEHFDVETFTIYVAVFHIGFIHSTANKVMLQTICGESLSNELEFSLLKYSSKRSTHCYVLPESPYPIMHTEIRLPDCRTKFQNDIQLEGIIKDVRQKLDRYKLLELKKVKQYKVHAKFLKSILRHLKNRLNELDGNLHYKVFKQLTEWDRNRIAYFHLMINDVKNSLSTYKKSLIDSDINLPNKIQRYCNELFDIIKSLRQIVENRLQDKWPELMITLKGGLNATFRADPRKYFYSQNIASKGSLSGVRHQIFFKDNACQHSCKHCGCISAIGDVCIWIGTSEERQDVTPDGFKDEEISLNSLMNCYFEYSVYVHQAKIRAGVDINIFCNPMVSIYVYDQLGFTQVVDKTLSPIWNETIKFNSMVFPGSSIPYKNYPPVVAMELFDSSSNGQDILLGTAILKPSVTIIPNTFQRKETSLSDMNVIYERNSLLQAANESVTQSGNDYGSMSEVVIKNQRLRQISHTNNARNKNGPRNSKLDTIDEFFPPPLKWIPVSQNGVLYAELLVSADFIQIPQISDTSKMVTNYYDIPPEIRPKMRRFKIEVLFTGLRNIESLPLTKLFSTEGKYKMALVFGELNMYSGKSTKMYGQSMNFYGSFVTGFLNLPEQYEYWPAIIIKHSKANDRKVIGAAMLSRPDKFSDDRNYVHNDIIAATSNADLDDKYSIDFDDIMTPLIESTTDVSSLSTVDKRKSTTEVSSKTTVEKFHSLTQMLKDVLPWNRKTEKVKVSRSSKELMNLKYRSSNESFTWWTKFYNSFDTSGQRSFSKHKIKIFASELENQPEYEYLQDWSEPILLCRGIVKRRGNSVVEKCYSTLKCKIKIRKNTETSRYKPEPRREIMNPLTFENRIVVRLYIIQGLNLRPMDQYGFSDPYIYIQYADHKITDRANFVANQDNPVFGQRYELHGTIPRDITLVISIYDRDEIVSMDDLIGTTVIDIEDRYRTKYHARNGIPYEYSVTGYNAWRDFYPPSIILNEICKKHNVAAPTYLADGVLVDGVKLNDTTKISVDEDRKERLSLSGLHQLNKVPSIGYNLIPEHVETRSLFAPKRPGIEQGKLQMWLEIYSPDAVPTPIDLTPMPPRAYELRVIVWNTADVVLQDTNLFGKKMSDIYVKGWLEDIDKAQSTDIHYRSLTGEGNFNWRMIFSFKYSKSDDMMVVTKKKSLYEQFDTEVKKPATLNIQIWDNDAISSDDFLGQINLTLSQIPIPSSTSKRCYVEKNSEIISLFIVESIRGWFPAVGKLDDGTIGLSGKVELELQVLSKDQAFVNPVGLGRNPPQPLQDPDRPDTSFKWYTNPVKSFKEILWPELKKILIIGGVVLLVGLLIIAMLYSLPSVLLAKLI